MLKGIRHVFFDLDRTLWDFDTNSRNAIAQLYRAFSLDRQIGMDDSSFLSVYEQVNEQYWERYRLGQVSQPELRKGRFLDSLRHFGVDDAEMAHAMGEEYVRISPRNKALVDGTMEVLHHLRGRYELHIITNGFEEVQHIKLESTGLRPYFGEVITSERAGVKKPDPGIFRFAERVTSSLPEHSLMIGDHLEADVLGARQAGWRAIHFTDQESNGDGHLRIGGLLELKALL
jgi:putative hydrolase of the HAD superfamily